MCSSGGKSKNQRLQHREKKEGKKIHGPNMGGKTGTRYRKNAIRKKGEEFVFEVRSLRQGEKSSSEKSGGLKRSIGLDCQNKIKKPMILD